MQNVIAIAKGIAQDYHRSATAASLPTIRCYAVGEKQHSEAYRIRPMAREWQVDAEGPLGAAYGAAFAAAILKSGHHTLLSNTFSSPRFPLRALWITNGNLPSDHALLCRRLIEMGHNSVVLENHPGIETLISTLRAHGIKIILLLTIESAECCPFDTGYAESMKNLFKSVPEADTILWKSSLLHPSFFRHPSARDATLADLVTAEMRLIEEGIGPKKNLIFYVPTKDHPHATQQMHWLPSLIDDAGARTAIAFPALAGDPTHDHQPLHPLWNFLRTDSQPSRTPLMPIMNAGAVGQGGGLWPYVNIDQMQQLHSRLNPLHFQGAIHLASALPQQGSFLDAALWTAGASLWLGLDPARAFETWAQAFRPALNVPSVIKAMEEVRRITLVASLMRDPGSIKLKPEECRSLADSLWAQLDALNEAAKQNVFPKESDRVPFNEYLLCFVRDIRKMLLHFLQACQQPCSKAVKQEDLQDSFWASVQAEAWQGIRSSGQVALLDKPNPGAEGSLINNMLNESYYLEFFE